MFFTEYRRAIANVKFADQAHPKLWKDKEEYELTNSSKWRCIFKLVHYLLKSDAEPFPKFNAFTGELEFPEKEEQAFAKSKIVLYFEFTSLLDVLKQALEFEGIDAVFVTGKSVTKKRTEAINQFMTDEDCRVMILSSVGNAGLNLHAAKFLIFMVQVVIHFNSNSCLTIIHRIRSGQGNKKSKLLDTSTASRMSKRFTSITHAFPVHQMWCSANFRARKRNC